MYPILVIRIPNSLAGNEAFATTFNVLILFLFFFLDFIAVIGWSSLSSHHLNLMLSLLGCCTCLVSLCAQLGYFLLKCSLLPLVHASWSVVYGCHVPKDHFCHSTRNKSNKKFLKPLHDCILPFTYS